MGMNMKYCMFENTYRALRECEDQLTEQDISELSESEYEYAVKLLNLCGRFYDDKIDQVE